MSMKMLRKLTLISAVAAALITAAAMAHGGHHGGGHHGVASTTVIAITVMVITVIAATTMAIGEDIAAMGMVTPADALLAIGVDRMDIAATRRSTDGFPTVSGTNA
jgi:preprotein translocase subunit SecY